MTLTIRPGDLHDPQLIALLDAHSRDMYATSPPESVHTLDVDALAAPAVRLVTVWDGEELLGCGAMKVFVENGAACGELKSMRTTASARGRGVATVALGALLDIARAEALDRLYLETGPQAFFAPARAFYAKHGFTECGPFANYPLDPYSVFMTRPVRERGATDLAPT